MGRPSRTIATTVLDVPKSIPMHEPIQGTVPECHKCSHCGLFEFACCPKVPFPLSQLSVADWAASLIPAMMGAA